MTAPLPVRAIAGHHRPRIHATRTGRSYVSTLETRTAAWLAAANRDDWPAAHRVADLMDPAEYAFLREAVAVREQQLRDGQPIGG